MRTQTFAALAVAAPLLIASSGTEAIAGGWRDCPPAAYYTAPVPAYRYSYSYSYYAPVRRSYYYSHAYRPYAYGPRIVGYGPAPYYRYRRPFAYYSDYGYAYGWGPSIAIGIGF